MAGHINFTVCVPDSRHYLYSHYHSKNVVKRTGHADKERHTMRSPRMRLFIVAHLLAPSAAARTRAEVHQSSKRAPPFHPLVVFKRGRTGSTWFADLLTNEPAVAFFAQPDGALRGV